jgi:glycosyltransferase involved in cell wall biosynthesis/DNA-binding CsgD family transcriptional regulator
MRVLVIHQNFPGQFGHLVRAWSRRPGWDVRALGRDTAPSLPGFDKLTRYTLARKVRDDQHPYLRQIEASTLHGQATARAMLQMRHSGFTPDVILAHPGWGETLFAKDVFPNARLVHLCEWYYGAEGADLGFDPEFPLSFDDRARIRMWNAQHALDLTQCDAAVSPTHWQRSRYPAILQPKIVVQHEGIDTATLGPNAGATITTPSGVVLKAGDPVITYVARNLEPYRGFHIFMRALERIQRADPRCHALIVGGDEVSYGKRPQGAANWREKMLAEVKLDPARTHFLGRIDTAQCIKVLQVSAAHVYLTYPLALSPSLLDAMACGATIVASNTAPVREVIRDSVNGRLVEFFDAQAIARTVLASAYSPREQLPLRRQARADAQAYSRAAAMGAYDGLIGVRDEGLLSSQPVSVALAMEAGPLELSERELELLHLVSRGHSNEEIAVLRHRSTATVRNQVSMLYQKLGVTRRAEAMALARTLRLDEWRTGS